MFPYRLPTFLAAVVIAIPFVAGCPSRNANPSATQAAATPPAAAKDDHAGHDHGPGESHEGHDHGPGESHEGHDHGPGESHAAETKTADKPAVTAGPSAQPADSSSPPLPGRKPPVPPPTTTTDRRRWDVPQAKSLAETPDVVLNSRVRARLISKLATGATDIWPETAKGVVTLTGTVPNAKLRAQAEQVARNERGVRTVRNKLTVKAGA